MSALEPMPYAAGMRWFMFTRVQDGKRYSIEIPAMSREEAERVAADQWGAVTYDGEIEGRVKWDGPEGERE